MDNRSRLTRFLIIYALVFGAYLYIMPRFFPQLMPEQRQQPTAAETSQRVDTLRADAAKAEAAAVDPQLSLTDRAKQWDVALRAYQQIERLGEKSDLAIDAKFQQARIFEARAQTDSKHTGDYDQAERIYKDLERKHARQRATLTLSGASTEVVVSEVARDKLQAVLEARDQRHKHDWRYRFLDFFVALTGRIPGFSYWFALLLITIIIKVLLFPFTKRQFKSMADMQRIAPKMKEVQEKLKGRPADEINRRVMAMYKEEGVNPAAGCVPMIAQMAVLIPLYTMIRMYEYQFRQGSFFWIGSELSHEYPRWIATSLAVPDVPLLILYCFSMVLTSKLQPPATDPQQAQMQKMMTYFMPIIFGWFTWIYAWPSAFTFYWLVLNVISTAQQWHILKWVASHPVPGTPPQSGGALPPSGPSGRDGGPGDGNGRNGGRTIKPTGSRPRSARKSSRR